MEFKENKGEISFPKLIEYEVKHSFRSDSDWFRHLILVENKRKFSKIQDEEFSNYTPEFNLVSNRNFKKNSFLEDLVNFTFCGPLTLYHKFNYFRFRSELKENSIELVKKVSEFNLIINKFNNSSKKYYKISNKDNVQFYQIYEDLFQYSNDEKIDFESKEEKIRRSNELIDLIDIQEKKFEKTANSFKKYSQSTNNFFISVFCGVVLYTMLNFQSDQKIDEFKLNNTLSCRTDVKTNFFKKYEDENNIFTYKTPILHLISPFITFGNILSEKLKDENISTIGYRVDCSANNNINANFNFQVYSPFKETKFFSSYISASDELFPKGRELAQENLEKILIELKK